MSDIQTLLNLIKTAVYGRDVRQAIHDAIRQCYDDGRAGAIDPTARGLAASQLAAAQARIEAFEDTVAEQMTAHEAAVAAQLAAMQESMNATLNTFLATHGTLNATLISETTLYETDPASRSSVQISISQATMAEYDFIDVYYRIGGNRRYARLTPAMLAGEINLDPIVYWGGQKSVIMYAPNLTPNGTGTKLVLTMNRWAWNGYASAAATLREATEATCGIYKVVGVKHISSSAEKDAELTDLRINPEGTTKASAGAMVRGELAAIYERLDELEAAAAATED